MHFRYFFFLHSYDMEKMLPLAVYAPACNTDYAASYTTMLIYNPESANQWHAP